MACFLVIYDSNYKSNDCILVIYKIIIKEKNYNKFEA